MWVHGIITSTEWDNWFGLRDHDAAQPEIRVLARKMREAMNASEPALLVPGQWHTPYITPADHELADRRGIRGDDRSRIFRILSTARCARISYTPFDGDPSWEKETTRTIKLRTEGHWSPFEHQATPDSKTLGVSWKKQHLHGNFRGWIQNRLMCQEE